MANRVKGHYIPRFYLRGFTNAVGELFVLDRQRKKQWKSTPATAACEADMYAGDGDGPERLLMEKAMAGAEGLFSEAIRQTLASRMLPTGTMILDLIDFVAVMATRVPKFRDWTDEFVANIKTVALAIESWTQEQRTAFDWLMEHVGVDPQVFCLEKLETVTKERNGETEAGRGLYLYMLANGAGAISGELRKRHWELWTCDHTAPDLICSDNPVSIAPRPGSRVQGRVGFGTPQTFVHIPLDRRVALIGMLEEPEGGKVLDAELVAVINRMTLRNANQIYSSTQEFVWYDDSGTVKCAAELLSE